MENLLEHVEIHSKKRSCSKLRFNEFKLNLLNTEALIVSEYKHLLNSETPNHLQQSTNDTPLCAAARWRAPEINTDSGKTSDEYSASLTQYCSNRADLLMCALTSGVPTNRQKGRAINTHANRRLAETAFFCV